MNSWNELTKMTRGEAIVIERVRLSGSGIRLEGEFEPPPLSKLSPENQVFIAAFVKSHGSIKEMEKLFGISYPTVKNRLNAVGEALGFPDIRPVVNGHAREKVLERLGKGEITADEAIEELKRC